MNPEYHADSDPGISSFDDLIDEVSSRFQLGESVDIDLLTVNRPEYRQRLRKLLPSLQAMTALGEHTTKQQPLAAGERLGDFLIVREIGRGGMGVVYEARQVSLHRRVALKVLPCDPLRDARRVQRFQREALAAAQLDHPHIVGVHAVGCERGVHYYAMRFVVGRPLSEVITQLRTAPGRMGVATAEAPEAAPVDAGGTAGTPARETAAQLDVADRQAARIGYQIASALEQAHQQGIVHRDVKPANILIDFAGSAWITDFGLAQHTLDATVTRSGDLIGTLRYMSPEQIMGRRTQMDHRTDVYSLGVTLYELLTHQPAFPSSNRSELFRQIVQDDPPRPRQANPRIPVDLETIVLKALAKYSEERYATAGEMAEDLLRFLNCQPIKARPPTIICYVRKWTRRHRTLAWTAGSFGLLLLILGSILLSVSNVLINAEQRRAHDALRELQLSQGVAQQQALQISEDLERVKAAQTWLERGRWCQRERRWDDAWIAFTQAVELRPENIAGWMERAELMTTLGLWDYATADFRRAFELDPCELSQRWYQFALLQLLTDDVAGYRQTSQNMRARFQGTLQQFMAVDLVRTCAVGAAEPQAFEADIELLNRLLRSSPDDGYFQYVLGLTLYRDGKYQAALDACQKSLAVDPDWPSRFINYPIIAMASHHAGQATLARQALDLAAVTIAGWGQSRRQAIDVNWVVHQGALGDWPVPWFDWLEFHYLFREASETLGEPAKQPSEDELGHPLLRARAMAGLRWRERADGEFAAALRLAPDEPRIRLELHRNRGAWFAQNQDWRRSAAEFCQAAELSPDDVLLLSHAAVSFHLAGDTAAYLQTCDRLLERFGSTPYPYVAVNVVYPCVLQPDAVANISRLRPLIDVGEAFWHAGSWSRGAALYRLGEFSAAVDCLEDAAKYHRPRAWELCFLAMAHQQLRQSHAARQYLSKASAWIQAADQSGPNDVTKLSPAWDDWHERPVVHRLWDEAARMVPPSQPMP